MNKHLISWMQYRYIGSVVSTEMAVYTLKKSSTVQAQLSLTGHSDDYMHGEAFLKFMGNNSQVKFRKDKKCYTANIVNAAISRKLKDLGMYSNKTNTIKYPDFIPDGLHSHFIRGLFDTDGCIYFRLRKRYKSPQGALSITGNIYMMTACASIISKELGLNPTTKQICKHNENTMIIKYEGSKRLLAIREWLYKDAESFLQRKKDKFYNCLTIKQFGQRTASLI